MKSSLHTQVLIIGAGVTGTGLARDLALRGVPSIVVEKADINSGASGGNHGLLHSGARYVISDPAAAAECQRENQLLKKVAPQCIEDTGGFFVAVPGDDENYIADFPSKCEQNGIPTQVVDIKFARVMEPSLSDRIIAVYQVEDSSIDPFKLSLNNINHARQLGCVFLRGTELINFKISHGRIHSVVVLDRKTSEKRTIEADVIANAAGAWADRVTALAGVPLKLVYSKGSLLVTNTRITGRVINRLRYPANGDILVPGGTVSVFGTTSERTNTLEGIVPEIREIDFLIDEGAAMLPVLSSIRYIRAYCGVRPLLADENTEDDRSVSRDFALIDHSANGDKIANFVTITGGKLTTYRAMAEKAADLICRHLRISASCSTRTAPLPDSDNVQWTQPGLAPALWLGKKDFDDTLICECEMVPKSVADNIIATIHSSNVQPSLKSIGLRSRIGKGSCQGTFCSQNLAAYLYDLGVFNGRDGVTELSSFLRERWRGQRPILWGVSLGQAELLEALQCGLFGLELVAESPE